MKLVNGAYRFSDFIVNVAIVSQSPFSLSKKNCSFKDGTSRSYPLSSLEARDPLADVCRPK
jgi:hypothetical protein